MWMLAVSVSSWEGLSRERGSERASNQLNKQFSFTHLEFLKVIRCDRPRYRGWIFVTLEPATPMLFTTLSISLIFFISLIGRFLDLLQSRVAEWTRAICIYIYPVYKTVEVPCYERDWWEEMVLVSVREPKRIYMWAEKARESFYALRIYAGRLRSGRTEGNRGTRFASPWVKLPVETTSPDIKNNWSRELPYTKRGMLRHIILGVTIRRPIGKVVLVTAYQIPISILTREKNSLN